MLNHEPSSSWQCNGHTTILCPFIFIDMSVVTNRHINKDTDGCGLNCDFCHLISFTLVATTVFTNQQNKPNVQTTFQASQIKMSRKRNINVDGKQVFNKKVTG